MLTTFLYCLFSSLIIISITISVVWYIQYKKGNAGIVDIFWGLSFPISAIIYLIISGNFSLRAQVFTLMILLWGLRLAVYLFGRNWKKQEDARYTNLKKEWGAEANKKMFFFYQFQGLLSTFLSIPFILILLNYREDFSILEIIAICLWVIALVGELTADEQMRRFKKDDNNKGKICNTGLWHYSRHPNYFFEWLIWVSYFIFALASPYGWIGIISPLLMFYFLLFVTGIKYSEDHMLASKGQAYLLYQQSTSPFIPLPKKKISKT